VQSPPEANCIEQIKHASQCKVRNLNPSPVTKREEAKRIESRVKSRASVVLNEYDKNKERTSDGSAEQQCSRERPCPGLHPSSSSRISALLLVRLMGDIHDAHPFQVEERATPLPRLHF